MPDDLTRRDFSTRMASLLLLPSATSRAFSTELTPTAKEVTWSESIHQEVTVDASRRRVYEALTDAKRFTALMAFSMVPKAPLAQIADTAGGAFALFDGHIVGRQLELVPDQRIVQAWRVVDWEPGIYSIARFQLRDKGSKTTVILDHTGFPDGLGKHLASGWHLNYWQPLEKYLAQSR
jgi:activator of HSP90 ATPase